MTPAPPSTSPPIPLPEHHCPLCGKPNACAAARTGSFGVACWCTTARVPAGLLDRVPPQQRGRACICQACAEAGTS